MADYTRQVLTGLAGLLDQAGLAAYREDGAYAAGETPVTFGAQHPTADACVTLTDYSDLADTATIVSRLNVQARTRHPNFLDGRDLVDGIRETLHRRTHVHLGQVLIGEIRLESFTPLGRDDRGRFEWSQNFTLTGLRPFQGKAVS